jgi:predicted helicase
VLVLTVNEESVARTFQRQLSDDSNELRLDDAAKIVGCWNGLAKRGDVEHSFEPDVRPMRRAIAFAGRIKDSKRVEELFQSVTDYYVAATDQDDDGTSPLRCSVEHVDGTMNALERNRKLDWLRDEPPEGSCRILTNARCLSEGVDVPALDAVMFLSPRKSVVDIVQSVGRVMRLDEKGNKQFGYIILPIGIPSGMTPEEALRDNKRYAAVWEVLQALRAHDERFDALVNRISLSTARDDKVNVIGVGSGRDGGWEQGELDLVFPDLDQWRDAIYAKIVQRVGSREYWTDWAKEVAGIAERQITRITALLKAPGTGVRDEFDAFLDGLRGNLNESITEKDAIEMLAQHLITRPVFNALFDGDEFLDNNPVAQTLERMLAALDQHDLEAENEALHRFYDSVRRKVADVKDREGRQELIRRLYDTFFSTAFKKTSDKLGIVYTPVQVVDFILRSADEVLRKEFNQSLSDPGVHILDGFAGTGTFIVRLLELGLIAPHDLARKYAEELHANEILLLAYYIAAVNIETTYLGVRRETDPETGYASFPGLILTDTFQSWEPEDRPDLDVFPENNKRLEALKKLPITVVVGNPPYSIGQDSANDDNANASYTALDEAIRSTYAYEASGSSVRGLYDSYVRAIKWATLRIGERGVVAYVTNGGFIDATSTDGLRKSLAHEFSAIHVYNLRGNQRTAGEQSRKEGGKIFGGGSRATVAITVLIKDPARTGPATVHYTEVADYLSREEKLARVAETETILDLKSIAIKPNEHGDWINQRSVNFGALLPLVGEGAPSVFGLVSKGLTTNRDAWIYNASRERVAASLATLRATYARSLGREPAADPTLISWSRRLLSKHARGKELTVDDGEFRQATYRPYFQQIAFFSSDLNEDRRRLPALYPTASLGNYGFYTTGSASPNFSLVACGTMPDLNLYGSGGGQFFPRYRYEPADGDGALFAMSEDGVAEGYRRIDNITDATLSLFAGAYGSNITKDDIFFYVYGILHSEEYRETYGADLKKTLPRIPLVEDPWPFVEAGRELAEIHLGYELETPYPLVGLDADPTGDPYDFFAVQRTAFARQRNPNTNRLEADKSTLIYNSRITLSGIPEDAHRYMLGSRSAIEWIIDRYRVKTDQASGIVNDPNEWSREVGDPRYIIDLFARIVTVSLRTMQIVDALPALAIRQEQ